MSNNNKPKYIIILILSRVSLFLQSYLNLNLPSLSTLRYVRPPFNCIYEDIFSKNTKNKGHKFSSNWFRENFFQLILRSIKCHLIELASIVFSLFENSNKLPLKKTCVFDIYILFF
jgi:hypothetical protein